MSDDGNARFARDLFLMWQAAERRSDPNVEPVRLPFAPFRLPGFLPPQVCADLIGYYDDAEWHADSSPNDDGGDCRFLVDLVVRASSGCEVTTALLADIYAHVVERTPLPRPWLVFGHVARSLPGPGSALARHYDAAYGPHVPWVGAILGLSDPGDYDGGEFRLDGEPFAKHQPGDLLIVPGHVVHEVAATTAGVRHAVALFYSSIPTRETIAEVIRRR